QCRHGQDQGDFHFHTRVLCSAADYNVRGRDAKPQAVSHWKEIRKSSKKLTMSDHVILFVVDKKYIVNVEKLFQVGFTFI
ncbi:MAG: hypothetical protein P8Z67_07275, partial [Gammaproteobacteria bacterium]